MPKTIAEILKETRISKGFNKSQMARELGIVSQLYGQYERGEVEPKSEFRKKFEDKFGISLVNIEDNVSRETDKVTEGEQLQYNKATKGRENKKVPLIGDAAASTDIEINTDQTYVEQYIDVGDLLRDSEAAFTVYGNSMSPNYPPGCIVGIRRNYDSFIMPGEIYLIETRSNRVFKRLFLTEDKTAYICYSDNTMQFETGTRKGTYAYPPFEIPLSDVVRLFDVTGMIKRVRNSGIIQRVS